MKSKFLRVDEDIILKGCELELAESIFNTVQKNRNYLSPWLNWTDKVQNVRDIQLFLKSANQFNIGGQQLNTWIFYQNEFCGNVSFVKIDKIHQVAELGYWLSESHTGKGIVTRSCERMIRYAFEKLGINRIVIRVSEENTASLKVPKRLGFYEEGIEREAYKIRDSFHNLKVFSLLQSEWKMT